MLLAATSSGDHSCVCLNPLPVHSLNQLRPSGIVLTANKHWTNTFQDSQKGIWTKSCERCNHSCLLWRLLLGRHEFLPDRETDV